MRQKYGPEGQIEREEQNRGTNGQRDKMAEGEKEIQGQRDRLAQRLGTEGKKKKKTTEGQMDKQRET